MGPGFLPLTVSAMLFAIGLIQLIRSMHTTGEPVDFKFKQPVIILITIVAFGFLLEKIGAILAVLLLMLVPAILHKSFTLKSFCTSYLFVILLLLIFKLALKSTIRL